MNSLTLERQAVADALTAAGMRASEFVPERFTPPIAAVTGGEPYIEKGQTFADRLVRLDVTVIAADATNKVASEALDALICKAMAALQPWTVEGVSSPFALQLGDGSQYLAARMTITQHIAITE